jgi:hypothetical protein
MDTMVTRYQPSSHFAMRRPAKGPTGAACYSTSSDPKSLRKTDHNLHSPHYGLENVSPGEWLKRVSAFTEC